MANVVIEFQLRTVRCEHGTNKPYGPGDRLVVPRSVARGYIACGMAREVSEVQTHVIPVEAKVEIDDAGCDN